MSAPPHASDIKEVTDNIDAFYAQDAADKASQKMITSAILSLQILEALLARKNLTESQTQDALQVISVIHILRYHIATDAMPEICKLE